MKVSTHYCRKVIEQSPKRRKILISFKMVPDHFMEGFTWHGYLLEQRTELVTQQIPFIPRSFFTSMHIYNQNLTLFHACNALCPF